MTATFVVAVLTIESMNLPIFRDMYHLNILLLNDVENIPKMYRHTLGDRIVTTAMNAYQQLQKAYDAQAGLRKLYAMEGFATELNTLSAFLRMANELRAIPLKRATDLFVRIDAIKKQLSGWRKATKGKTKA